MKKEFTEPVMEITSIESEDIILTSRSFGDNLVGNHDIDWGND